MLPNDRRWIYPYRPDHYEHSLVQISLAIGQYSWIPKDRAGSFPVGVVAHDSLGRPRKRRIRSYQAVQENQAK